MHSTVRPAHRDDHLFEWAREQAWALSELTHGTLVALVDLP